VVFLSKNSPAEKVEIPKIPAPEINNSEIPISAAAPDLLNGSEKSTEIDGGADENTEDFLWL